MLRNLLLVVLLALQANLFAQQTIVMRDKTKISATIVDVTSDKLKLKEGAVSTSLVAEVYYKDSLDAQQNDKIVQLMLYKDILVYANQKLVLKKEIAKLDLTKTETSPRSAEASDRYEFTEPNEMSFGFGLGINYGGIGGQFQYYPEKHIGLFAGGGYSLLTVGYNLGVEAHLTPDKSFSMFFSAMYGTNGFIIVEGASQFNKSYTGFSMGLGAQFANGRNPKNFFKAQIILPFRPDYDRDLDALKNNPSIIFEDDPWPVLISFGYHFGNHSRGD